MFSTVLAAIGLITCIALAVHVVLPLRARSRVDNAVRGVVGWFQSQFSRLTGWRRHHLQSRAASQEADRVIRRARDASLRDQGNRPDGEWDGNVYRPKSFEKPKKPH